MGKDETIKGYLDGIQGRLQKLLKERCDGVVLKMAEDTGIKRASLHLYIKENRTPTLDPLIRISLTYDVSLEWLITGKNAQETDLKAAQKKARELIGELQKFVRE